MHSKKDQFYGRVTYGGGVEKPHSAHLGPKIARAYVNRKRAWAYLWLKPARTRLSVI